MDDLRLYHARLGARFKFQSFIIALEIYRSDNSYTAFKSFNLRANSFEIRRFGSRLGKKPSATHRAKIDCRTFLP